MTRESEEEIADLAERARLDVQNAGILFKDVIELNKVDPVIAMCAMSALIATMCFRLGVDLHSFRLLMQESVDSQVYAFETLQGAFSKAPSGVKEVEKFFTEK